MKDALDHISQRVRRDMENGEEAEGYTPVMTAYRAALEGRDAGGLTEAISLARDMRSSHKQREIIESLILGKCPPEVVDAELGIDREALAAYCELFFDMGVFRTKLDIVDYMESYPDNFGRELKIKAVNIGYEFVLYTYANLVPKDGFQRSLVERMFMSTALKAMAMNYVTMDSDTCKHAIKHGELMLRAYDLLVKSGNGDDGSARNLMLILGAKEVEEAAEPEINPAEIV